MSNSFLNVKRCCCCVEIVRCEHSTVHSNNRVQQLLIKILYDMYRSSSSRAVRETMSMELMTMLLLASSSKEHQMHPCLSRHTALLPVRVVRTRTVRTTTAKWRD